MFVVLSLLLVILLLISGISYAVSPQEQAKICAEENLSKYLNMVGDAYSDFHFSSREDLAKASLGEPIPNVRIEMEEFDEEKTFKKQAEPFAFYVFPVLVDGKPVTDFTVSLEDGKWKPLDIGGHLSTVIYDMAKKDKYKPEDSIVLRFMGETFVLVNQDGQEYGYAPYHDDADMGIKSKKLIPSEDFRKALNKKVEAEIRIEKEIEKQYKNSDTKEVIIGGNR